MDSNLKPTSILSFIPLEWTKQSVWSMRGSTIPNNLRGEVSPQLNKKGSNPKNDKYST